METGEECEWKIASLAPGLIDRLIIFSFDPAPHTHTHNNGILKINFELIGRARRQQECELNNGPWGFGRKLLLSGGLKTFKRRNKNKAKRACSTIHN